MEAAFTKASIEAPQVSLVLLTRVEGVLSHRLQTCLWSSQVN